MRKRKQRLAMMMVVLLISSLLTPTFIHHAGVAYAEGSGVKQLKDMNQGDEITFAGQEWIVLEPIEGYIFAKESLGQRQFDSNNKNKFDPTDRNNIGYYLNTTYYGKLTISVQAGIKEREWDIEQHGKVTSKIGLLSLTEWDTYKYAVLDNPSEKTWLRTPVVGSDFYVWYVQPDGFTASLVANNSHAVRPALTLNSDIYVSGTGEVMFPEVSFTPDRDYTWAKKHTAKVNVSHLHGGIKELQYQWSKSTETPGDGDWIYFTNGDTVTTPAGATGAYYLHVRGLDARNNVVLSDSSEAFKLDNTKPTLTVEMTQGGNGTDYINDTWTKENVYVTVNAKDQNGLSGLKSLEIWQDGIAVVDVEGAQHQLIFEQEGTYNLDIKAADYAGNEAIERRTIKINRSGLMLESKLYFTDNHNQVYVSGEWTNRSVTAEVYAQSELGLTVTSMVYSLDQGTNWFDYTIPLTFSEEGIHSLWFKAQDEASNEKMNKLSINIDTTPPEIQFVPNGTTTPSQNVFTAVTVHDTRSGIDTSSLKYVWSTRSGKLGDHGQVDWKSFQNGDILTYTGTTGTWYLHIRTKDQGGNKSYTISNPFYLDNPADRNALLHGLIIGTEPVKDFASNVTNYTVNVGNHVSDVTVTPTAEVDTATIQVRIGDGEYVTVPSGVASEPLKLNVGDNKVEIRVTARDEETIKTYTVNIVRETAQSGGSGYVRSSNAKLSELILSDGRLTPTFSMNVTNYTVQVAHEVESLTLIAKTEHHYATIKANGQSLVSGRESEPISLVVGEQIIEILVIAEDGTKQKYVITVTREPEEEVPHELEKSPLCGLTMINFFDLNGHWAEVQIQEAICGNMVQGYPEGSFQPNKPITRAEFITLVIRAFELEQRTGKVFEDTVNHWAKDMVATAHAYGLITGYSDTRFGADDVITREQMAMIIAKLVQMMVNEGGWIKSQQDKYQYTIFTDADEISTWAQVLVALAVEMGLLSGYPDGSLRPQQEVTRAEAVTIILRALSRVQE